MSYGFRAGKPNIPAEQPDLVTIVTELKVKDIDEHPLWVLDENAQKAELK